jgi:hypothetical protein
MRKIHHVNNPSDVLKSQATNSSGSKKRKWSKISLPNKNRKLGLNYEVPSDLESADERKKRKQRLRSKISYQLENLNIPENEIPSPPSLSNDSHVIKVMICIRKFELEHISLSIICFSICKERRIGMKISNEVYKRCSIDKNIMKLYSEDNNMDL